MTDTHNKLPTEINALLNQLAGVEYCYVTTTGRVSGRPHEIEIWFGVNENSLYLLSGGGENSDWVKNMRANPSVIVRIGKHTLSGMARFVLEPQEDILVRHSLAGKYQGWREGRRLSGWAQTALPVAIDLN